MEKINEAKINSLINTNIKLIYAKLFLVVISFALLFIGGAKSAGAATLYFFPASGSYIVGDTFSISVFVSSAEQAINAASGVISFSQEKLEIISLAMGDSIFDFWVVKPAFSNCAGAINFEGIELNPGFVGLGGKIISINFKAKVAGSAALIFSSGSVLANDGHGTNILTNMGDGSYMISAKAASQETAKELITQEVKPSPVANNEDKEEKTVKKNEETAKTAAINKPEIISLTHPDQSAWYNNNDIEFKWELPHEATGVSILLNNWPFSDPGPLSDGLFSDKSYQDIKDGIWYLHLKLKDQYGWSEIEHFRVQINTETPELFNVAIDQEDISAWPTLYFETRDTIPGIDRYEIKIASQKFVVSADETSFKIPVLDLGKYTAFVKAIDKAGNETAAYIDFTIEPIEAPNIKNYTQELDSNDKLFISGISLSNVTINVFIQKVGTDKIIKQTSQSDSNGNWYIIFRDGLAVGRYLSWAEAINKYGRKSEISNKVSFLVTPPVFVKIGSWIISYFTIFVVLLLFTILVIALLAYWAGLTKNKLKKETDEAQAALHKNLKDFKKLIEREITFLDSIEGEDGHSRERIKIKRALKSRVDFVENKILKEIRDIENLLPDLGFDDKISKLKRIIKK